MRQKWVTIARRGEARRLTDGRGVDHVVEVGGAGTLGQSMEPGRYAGTIALIGRLSEAPAAVSVPAIFSQNMRLLGVTVGNRAQSEDMVRAIEINGVHPIIDAAFPLETIASAFQHMADGKTFGKIVVETQVTP